MGHRSRQKGRQERKEGPGCSDKSCVFYGRKAAKALYLPGEGHRQCSRKRSPIGNSKTLRPSVDSFNAKTALSSFPDYPSPKTCLPSACQPSSRTGTFSPWHRGHCPCNLSLRPLSAPPSAPPARFCSPLSWRELLLLLGLTSGGNPVTAKGRKA